MAVYEAKKEVFDSKKQTIISPNISGVSMDTIMLINLTDSTHPYKTCYPNLIYQEFYDEYSPVVKYYNRDVLITTYTNAYQWFLNV
jgi:hypothetical protein